MTTKKGRVIYLRTNESFSDQFHIFLISGVYRSEPQDIYIDINGVKDLHSYTLSSDKLVLGANMSLTRTMEVMNKVAAENPNTFGYLKQLASHIDLIANVPVRNVRNNKLLITKLHWVANNGENFSHL